MKAAEITDRVVSELQAGRWRHARLNYANGDMVGHTGRLDASIIAVEAVDLQIGRLIRTVGALEGALIVTADHGNCDEMYELDADGTPKLDGEGRPRPRTSHSLNRVPFYIYAPRARGLRVSSRVATPTLADFPATALYLMGYAAPIDYAPSLVES